MAWKPTGRPTVRQQRDKWVVRVDGIDTETGKHRPRQLGTFTSRRSAPDGGDVVRRGDGEIGGGPRHRRPSRRAVGGRPRRRVGEGPPAVRVGRRAHQGRARRDPRSTGSTATTSPGGSTAWPPAANMSRRSIQIFRMVLRAALADAVEAGAAAPQPGGPGRHATSGRQGRPGAGGRGVGRGRPAAVPRRRRRPPLGGADPPRRALRAAPQRAARPALVRPST